MTAIGLMISAADRERLLARVAELRDLDRLVRQPGQLRPPEPPTPLATIAVRSQAHDAPGKRDNDPTHTVTYQ
jgi:hypothetical protein